METTITWKPEIRQIADLKDWERNPRTITGEALDKLKERIAARGFHDVVKIDTNGVILSGTQRRKALVEMGAKEVWAMVPDRELTEEEREKIVLESNRNDGDWDWSMLKGFDMPVLLDVGFSQSELMVNFGLDSANDVDVSAERLMILAVLPPETPSLKDRAAIKFTSKDEYDQVKAAIQGGVIGAADLLELVKNKK